MIRRPGIVAANEKVDGGIKMTCYREGGCGPYEYRACNECPASKPEYTQKDVAASVIHVNKGGTMTNQEKISYLKQYRESGKTISQLKDEIAQWRSLAEKITPSLSPVPPSTAGGGRMETAVEHIEALQKELFEKIVRLAALRREIGQAIETIPDGRLSHLLRCRYIEGLTFERIAERECIDIRWVFRLHRKAIQEIAIESHT